MTPVTRWIPQAIALLSLLIVLPCQAASPPELIPQVGHHSTISALAYSPDGTRLASGSWDHRVKIWDARTGELLLQFDNPTFVMALAWSPDGKTLAVSVELDGEHGKLTLHNAQTGQWLGDFSGLKHDMESIAFSPDGKLLAGADGDSVRLWQVDTRKALRAFTLPNTYFSAVAFSPDGRALAGVSYPGTVFRWDIRSGKAQQSLHVAPDKSWKIEGFHALAYSPDGKMLAAGGTRVINPADIKSGRISNEMRVGEVEFWDPRTGRLLRVINPAQPYYIKSLSFSQNSRLLAIAGGETQDVLVCDVQNGIVQILQTKQDGYIEAIAFAPDNCTLAASSPGNNIQIWNTDTGTVMQRLPAVSERIACLGILPDGKTLCAGDIFGSVQCWDLSTGARVSYHRLQLDNLASLTLAADGKHLVGTSSTFETAMWNLQTGDREWNLPGTPDEHDWFEAGARSVLSPDGKVVARWNYQGCMLWDVATRKPGEMDYSLCGPLTFSPDGAWLAGTGLTMKYHYYATDHMIHLYSLRHEESRYFDHGAIVHGIAFSPDSKLFVSLGDDHNARLWDIASGTMLRSLPIQGSWSRDAVFSSDGRLLAVDEFEQVSIWETATGRLVRRFTGVNSSSVFTPDSRMLIAQHLDGSLRVWDIATGQWRLALLSFPGKSENDVSSDWIAYTPDGYYDASPGAARFIRWRDGAKLLPADVVTEKFHRTDLIREALR